MAKDNFIRKLAAVVAADVAGYTRLMEADEDATMNLWWQARERVIDPQVEIHHGRVVKLTGDGFLAEFPTVFDAMQCASEMQSELAAQNEDVPIDQRMYFRMGITLGDIMIDDEDIYGNGVNIAARLQELADPGGICISSDIYRQVVNKFDFNFEDIGLQKVKHISEPLHAFKVGGESYAAGSVQLDQHDSPHGPSIAVLPFTNIGNVSEYEYFADGMADDLITALSKIRWFYVVARNSSFAYKGKSPDVRQVAKELDVRYVLEGSVRADKDRIRVNAQLIDGCNGKHVWAKKYDREIKDIFEVQDEITQSIVGELEPEMSRAEQDRAKSKQTKNLDSWSLYQRGMAYLHRRQRHNLDKARSYFEQSIEADPQFGQPYAALAQSHFYYLLFGWLVQGLDHKAEALAAGCRAIELDDENPSARVALGIVHIIRRETDSALLNLDKAIDINPSDATAHRWKGVALIWSGRSDEGIRLMNRALSLSPHDPNIGRTMARLAEAYLFTGETELACEWAQRALQETATQFWGDAVLTSVLGHLGRTEEAKSAKQELLRKRPEFTRSFAKSNLPICDPDDLQTYLAGLEKADIPA